eukprot:s2316_g1.t1
MFQERSRRIAEELQGRGKNCTGPAKETKTCSLEELPCLSGQLVCFLKGEGNGQRVSDRLTLSTELASGKIGPFASLTAMEFKKEPDLFWFQPPMVAFPVAYTWSRDRSQSRTRSVDRPKVGQAQDCIGASKESQDCNTMSCPVDCQMSDWTKWSTCSPYCLGTQNRSRTVMSPASNGGAACGVLNQSQRCTNFCMDCQLSDWTGWSKCSKSCEGTCNAGQHSASWSYKRVPGAWGYQKSMGVRCDPAHQRNLDGGGSPQDAEALCSADPSCGGLYDRGCDNWLTLCNVNFTLEREEGSCSYLKQEIGQGQPCEGDISQTMTCNEQLCPVDCAMGRRVAPELSLEVARVYGRLNGMARKAKQHAVDVVVAERLSVYPSGHDPQEPARAAAASASGSAFDRPGHWLECPHHGSECG